MDTVQTEDYRGHTIDIRPDTMDTESPREYDNLGHMVCFHKRYTLGDKHDISSDDFTSWEELEEYLCKEKGAVICLSIRMYDHGGITISCSDSYPYNDQWDAGMIGFIYVSKQDILNNWNMQRVSARKLEHAKQILLSEVATYDSYLMGEVYGYEITDPEGEQIDSCWGYIGSEYIKEMISECKSIVDSCIKDRVEQHSHKLKGQIKNSVNLQYRQPVST